MALLSLSCFIADHDDVENLLPSSMPNGSPGLCFKDAALDALDILLHQLNAEILAISLQNVNPLELGFSKEPRLPLLVVVRASFRPLNPGSAAAKNAKVHPRLHPDMLQERGKW